LLACTQLAGWLERTWFLALIVTFSVDPGDRPWSRPKITPWMLRTGPLGSWVCEQAQLVS